MESFIFFSLSMDLTFFSDENNSAVIVMCNKIPPLFLKIPAFEPSLTFFLCLLLAAALGAAVMYFVLTRGRHGGEACRALSERDDSEESVEIEQPAETEDIDVRNDGKKPFRDKREEEFLAAFTDLVEKNISNGELDIKFIESNMNMSRSSIFRHLKMATGLSIVESVRQIRLNKSREMLADGLPVTDTAYACGFNDPAYFCRLFKKSFGLTPSQYQLQQKLK